MLLLPNMNSSMFFFQLLKTYLSNAVYALCMYLVTATAHTCATLLLIWRAQMTVYYYYYYFF